MEDDLEDDCPGPESYLWKLLFLSIQEEEVEEYSSLSGGVLNLVVIIADFVNAGLRDLDVD